MARSRTDIFKNALERDHPNLDLGESGILRVKPLMNTSNWQAAVTVKVRVLSGVAIWANGGGSFSNIKLGKSKESS
jgi:hypothetical protein